MSNTGEITGEKLIREQLLAEPAGRRMDYWVSQRVFDRWPDSLTADMVPDYSTDIAAAWQVVEKLVSSGWGAFGWDGFDHGHRWIVGFGNSRAEAATMPLAVCRAALLVATGA